jgi:hypothetical protein
MHNRKSLALTLILASIPFAGAWATTGCAASSENTGETASELRTPIPIFRAVASPDAARELDVHEWRVYRGKHEYVVTGYDPSGRAISGFALGAYGHTASTASHLRMRMLDGSQLKVRPSFQGPSPVSGEMSAKSSKLVARALSDFSVIEQSTSNADSLTVHGTSGAGLHVLGGISIGPACTGVIAKLVQDGMQCGTAVIQSAQSSSGSTGSSGSSSGISATTIAECLKAAGDLLQLDAACTSGSSSTGGLPAPLPSGTSTGGAYAAPSSPAAASSGSSGSPVPYSAATMIDEATTEQSCPSCPAGSGNGTDVNPNEENGGVGLGGDTGNDDYGSP